VRNRAVEEAEKQISELPKFINVGQQNKHIVGTGVVKDEKPV
jgi:hypothetical protein